MNKEVIYIEDKVIVADQDGSKKQVDNYVGLDKLLVQENIVESIENDIELLKDKLSKLSPNINWFRIFSPIFVVITSLILSYFVMEKFLNFGYISMVAVEAVGALFIPGSLFVSLVNYIFKKMDLRKRNGYQFELDVLEKQLCNEKEKLEELNKQKELAECKKIKQSFKVVSVNHKEELEKLRNDLILSYHCGYYEEKYAKYYQNGTLDKKLSEQYDKEQIQNIKEYLEEKGYQKVLKKGE